MAPRCPQLTKEPGKCCRLSDTPPSVQRHEKANSEAGTNQPRLRTSCLRKAFSSTQVVLRSPKLRARRHQGFHLGRDSDWTQPGSLPCVHPSQIRARLLQHRLMGLDTRISRRGMEGTTTRRGPAPGAVLPREGASSKLPCLGPAQPEAQGLSSCFCNF